jgi:hypothetical protein
VLWVRRWLTRPFLAWNVLPHSGWAAADASLDLSFRLALFCFARLIRFSSCNFAPLFTLERQALRSRARSSHVSGSMWNSLVDTFMESLCRFFWPPLEREPFTSSPYKTCFGMRAELGYKPPQYQLSYRRRCGSALETNCLKNYHAFIFKICSWTCNTFNWC